MAESLSREGPLDVLENAIRVLREAGISTVFPHWIGSIPFALAVLMFLLQVSDSRAADPVVAMESLGLAVLFVWMNCWRSVFAGSVRARLSGEVRPRGRISDLIAVQSLAGATKLLILPFASLIVFPLPAVVAFYRSLAVFASRPVDGGPREIFSRARRLARYQPEQSWLLFPLFFLFALVVWLNCLAIIGAAPQLARILTGYESTFSRSGINFAMSSMCIGLSLAVAWVVFDPFIQTVYCIRCYQAESLETGEDVRAGIRGLRLRTPAAAAMVALFVFAAFAPIARATVAPADLQKASAAAMQSPEYSWRLPPPEKAGPHSVPWIVSLFNRLADSTKSIRHAISRAVDAFFRWLGGELGGAQPQSGALPGGGLHWTVWLVIAIASGIIAFIVLRILRSRHTANDAAPAEAIQSVRLDAEDLTADRMPEDQWIELADQSLREGNLRLALRAFYLANLSWMGRAEFISIHPGKTNREYELELRRRGRSFPEARALFGANVADFEHAWYGLRDVAMDEIEEFRDRGARMKAILTGGTGAAA